MIHLQRTHCSNFIRIFCVVAGAGLALLACHDGASGPNLGDMAMSMPGVDLAMTPMDAEPGQPHDAGTMHDAATGDMAQSPPIDMSQRSGAGWMGTLPATTSLAALSIPGTHDSGARIENSPGTLKCQDLSIADQLGAGVRYLDIRVRNVNNAFEVYHTTLDQNLSFDAVLQSIADFYAAHPGEAILMSFKEEQPATGSTNSFEQTFDAYVSAHPERWYLAASVPTLAQARGKIVLLRRFATGAAPKGIDVTNWPDNVTFGIDSADAHLRIQDYYEVSDDDAKWASITGLFTEAKAASASVLYLNNTSAYLPLAGGVEDILGVSNVINPKLVTYFMANRSGRFGIVAMDFADVQKSALIIATNFP